LLDWSSLFDVPLSPTKALRYATIKHRFADTILKAQNKAPLHDVSLFLRVAV
jgi:hypothetical protein